MSDESDFDLDPEDFGGMEAVSQMGKLGLSVYRAVIRDGGTENEAFAVTAAFFAGMAKANASDQE